MNRPKHFKPRKNRHSMAQSVRRQYRVEANEVNPFTITDANENINVDVLAKARVEMVSDLAKRREIAVSKVLRGYAMGLSKLQLVQQYIEDIKPATLPLPIIKRDVDSILLQARELHVEKDIAVHAARILGEPITDNDPIEDPVTAEAALNIFK